MFCASSRHLLIFLLVLFTILDLSSSKQQPAPVLTTPLPPKTAAAEDLSIILISLTDGTLIAYDAITGKQQWKIKSPKPPITSKTVSVTVPGQSLYFPGIDGRLYKLEDDTIKPVKGHLETAQGSAFVLSHEETSAIYIDARTGNLVRTLTYNSPPDDSTLWVPTLADRPLVVLKRKDISFRVRHATTLKVIAEASLAHMDPLLLQNGRSIRHNDPAEDVPNLEAEVIDRSRLVVWDIETRKPLWKKTFPLYVHDMSSVGKASVDVRYSESQALPGPEHVGDRMLVVRQSGQMFALPAARKALPGMAIGAKVDNLDGRNSALRDGSYLVRKYNDVEDAEDPDLGDYEIGEDSNDGGSKRRLELVAAFVLGGIVLVFVYRRLAQYINPPKKSKRSKSRKRRRTKAATTTDEDGKRHEKENGRLEAPNDENEQQMQTRASVQQQGLDYLASPPSNHSTNSTGSTNSSSIRTADGWITVGRLRVSPKVLGNGSHGTVVYEGLLTPGNRRVAVKRLLRHLFESARQEISLLIELDEASPHVLRYYAMEEDETFIYLALELCSGSLGERVISCDPPALATAHSRGAIPPYTHRCLRNLMQGLADLHTAGVVHRDLKPQNVLLGRSSSGSDVKLADVGLALRLAGDRSSYTAVMNANGCIGTRGWCAAEVIAGKRQTRKVDIFAAGCVLHFVLTKGKHPFGDTAFDRDANIASGKADLTHLQSMEVPEAEAVIQRMISVIPKERPSAKEVLKHPFFWSDATKLSFLCDVSDRLYDLRFSAAFYTRALDSFPPAVQYLSEWPIKLDTCLLITLNRGYHSTPSELLRVIRNKRSHFSELDAEVRRLLGRLPDDHSGGVDDGQNFLTYFTNKFPHLLMSVYEFTIMNPFLVSQHHFRRYGFASAEPSEQFFGESDDDYSDYSPLGSVSSFDRNTARFIYTDRFLRESQERYTTECQPETRNSFVYDPSVRRRWKNLLSHLDELLNDAGDDGGEASPILAYPESMARSSPDSSKFRERSEFSKVPWTSRSWNSRNEAKMHTDGHFATANGSVGATESQIWRAPRDFSDLRRR